jgi:hypothetical protein
MPGKMRKMFYFPAVLPLEIVSKGVWHQKPCKRTFIEAFFVMENLMSLNGGKIK